MKKEKSAMDWMSTAYSLSTMYTRQQLLGSGGCSPEEATLLGQQMQALCERVTALEDKIGAGDYPVIRVVQNMDLHDARIDYSNEVTRQWSELRILLCLGLHEVRYTGPPIILNRRILNENEGRLIYKGYKCAPIPYTHYTLITYVGELKFTMHLEQVD